jgi:hypothetical protein
MMRAEPHPIYHLDLQIEHCRARVSLNGLPIVALRADDQPRSHMPPINPYLVGHNEVYVELMPLSPEDEKFETFGEVVLHGSVRRFKKGGPASPQGGVEIVAIEIPDYIREQDDKVPPLGFSFEFDSPDAPSFAPELVDAPRERDREAMIDYGMRLCGIVSEGDAGRLLKEMEPKLDAYARAFDEPNLAFRHDLQDYLTGEFFPAGVEVDFPRTEVRAQPVCSGRLWHITREGAPLLRTRPDAEGTRSQIEIYVGRYDNRLRVAR